MSDELTIVGFVGDPVTSGSFIRQNTSVVEDEHGQQFAMATPNPDSDHHLLPIPSANLPQVYLFKKDELRQPFTPSIAPPFTEEQTVVTVNKDLLSSLVAHLPDDAVTQQFISWEELDETMHRAAVVNRKQHIADRQEFLRRVFPLIMARKNGADELVWMFRAMAPAETLEYLSFLGAYYQAEWYPSRYRQERVIARAKRHGVAEEEFQELVNQVVQQYL
jgi:hypothetical protein